MLRTVNDQPTLWDAVLPPELLVLPVELGRVDALLEDPVFFGPFAAHFDARIGRPSIAMETYVRLMFLKFRYRLGYESLCREVSDSISWQRFCRIPFGTRVPHPTTLMKITTRCGEDAVAGLNEALLAKAAAAKLLRTDKVRADTTVIPAAMSYPRPIRVCWPRRSVRWPAVWRGSRARKGRAAETHVSAQLGFPSNREGFLMLRPVGLQRVSRIGRATSMRRSCVGVGCCRSPGTRAPQPGVRGLSW